MNIEQMTYVLRQNPKATLRFDLPSGDAIPSHFHLTEVGRVQKTFIDCGGTRREATSCQLQLWSANDVEHRLVSEKLLAIIELASSILQSSELPVEVEYGETAAASYTIGEVVSAFGEIRFSLVGKQTDCLAKDKCGVDGSCETQSELSA